MPILARDLFTLARKVELDIAALYESIAARRPAGSPEAKFFSSIAAQEHVHAAWVDEMMAQTEDEFSIDNLSTDEFQRILLTLEDVRDEVENVDLPLVDLLDICLHLENSTAENFYLHFPEDVPGLHEVMIRRMAQSCRDHAKAIVDFQAQCRAAGAE